jgi:hypothetical protein
LFKQNALQQFKDQVRMIAFYSSRLCSSLSNDPFDQIMAKFGFEPFGGEIRHKLTMQYWINKVHEESRKLNQARVIRGRRRSDQG